MSNAASVVRVVISPSVSKQAKRENDEFRNEFGDEAAEAIFEKWQITDFLDEILDCDEED